MLAYFFAIIIPTIFSYTEQDIIQSLQTNQV